MTFTSIAQFQLFNSLKMINKVYLSIGVIFMICPLVLMSPVGEEDLTITIIHTNDVHSRFAQTNKHSGSCSVQEEESNQCFGGFARLHYKVRVYLHIKKLKQNNILFLCSLFEIRVKIATYDMIVLSY